MLRTLGQFLFSDGYNSSSGKLSQNPNEIADGSSNVLFLGTSKNHIFKGVKSVAATPFAGKVSMNVGDTFASLGDYNETGIGSVFRVLGAVFFIGSGKFYYEGADTSATATTALSIKKVVSGALGTTYQAGLAKPSAPTIAAVTAPTGLTGKNNGVVSAKIARIRAATGAKSNASLTSNVITCTNQSVSITFPSVDANGQDYWEIDVTRNGEGAVGNHYFLQELPESVLTATVTASRVSTSTTSVGLPNGTLTSANIGWQYTSAGDTTTYVTAVGANDSYAAGKQDITLAAASVLTNTQNATFTRAVAGVLRTFVVEWRDSDLVGADLAPVRDYPPPAAIFGGSSGDVTFVDGALGDSVNVTQYARDNSIASANTTTTYVGNAIAVSDPAKPESYPVDNYIFTGDAPTALLAGGSGIHWRFAKNSLGVLRYVGGSPAMSYERLWMGIGVQKQHNACLGAGGRLYAYTGARGLVRLGTNGEPDTSFASPVSEDMASWNPANVVLAYDADHQCVLAMHEQTILAFHEPTNRWSAPLDAEGSLGTTATIKSAVTVNGSAYIGYGESGVSASFYQFNVAQTGPTTDAVVYTPWMTSQEITDVISRLHCAIRQVTQADVTVKVYTNGSATASSTQVITPGTGSVISLPVLRPNVRNAKTWRISIAFSTADGTDGGFEGLRVEGESQNISM